MRHDSAVEMSDRVRFLAIATALLGQVSADHHTEATYTAVGQTGKSPDCPVGDGLGWRWSNLANSKLACDRHDLCNVIVHYSSGTGDAHSYLYACPDPDNISWITTSSGQSGEQQYHQQQPHPQQIHQQHNHRQIVMNALQLTFQYVDK